MRFKYLLILVAFTGSLATAGPYWDLSISGTTYQEWNFTTAELLSNPDNPDDNPYATGPVTGQISGSQAYPDPEWNEDGYWFNRTIGFTVDALPNTQNTGPQTHKKIIIDIGLHGDISLVNIFANDTYYYPLTIQRFSNSYQAHEKEWDILRLYFEIKPNPTQEDICLGFNEPDEGNIQELDFVHISTICIPEPASLTLLAAGGLALLKKRRSLRQ